MATSAFLNIDWVQADPNLELDPTNQSWNINLEAIAPVRSQLQSKSKEM